MRHLYTFLLHLILPIFPCHLWYRSLKNRAYRQNIAERFGMGAALPSTQHPIWLHAVSVGEAIAAFPLIRKLRMQYPHTPILVTTTTPTGRARLAATFGDQIILRYLPYDYPWALQTFLRKMHPQILLIMETEIWPNLFYYAHKAQLPIILINARLSQHTFCGYQKIKRLITPILSYTSAICVQSMQDYQRFNALGARSPQLHSLGNVKFDLAITPELLTAIKNFKKQLPHPLIWVAASTHSGEEEIILRAQQKILQSVPNALLILVPRHPERFALVEQLCHDHHLITAKYSNIATLSPKTHVLIGDIMGKLLLFYGVSDIAFVGGSLIPWGGHNLLEPAALAKPVLSGPHLTAFAAISQTMLDHNALTIVNTAQELADTVLALHTDREYAQKLGTAALDIVEQHRGATQRTLDLIKTYLHAN